MFITIRNATNKITHILDANEIVKVKSLHHAKIIIIFKRRDNTEIFFNDREEAEFFMDQVHIVLKSLEIKNAPSKELRDLEKLTKDEEESSI